MTTIIIGAGASGLQMAYFFEKFKIDYLILEKNNVCGSFYSNNDLYEKLLYPINDNFNINKDYYSLLCDDIDDFNFSNYMKNVAENKNNFKGLHYHNYLNEFAKKYNLKINYNNKVYYINKINDYYSIHTNIKIYKCIKIIIAFNNYDFKNNFGITLNHRLYKKHIFNLEHNYFYNNLNKFKNKKILLIGLNNFSLQLCNLLCEHVDNIIIINDINNNYNLNNYKFNFNNNNICIVNYDIDDLKIEKNNNSENNIDQFFVIKNNRICYFNNIKFFDEIINCLIPQFNTDLFNKKINFELCDDFYQKDILYINSSYFIDNNKKSIYYKRFIIKNIFLQYYFIIFENDDIIVNTENINNFYINFVNHILERFNDIEIKSSLGYVGDIFYFDELTKTIKYKKNKFIPFFKYNNNFLLNEANSKYILI